MEDPKLEWYIDSIRTELKRIKNVGFYGSVEFQLNVKDSNITNMMVEQRKSIVFVPTQG